MIIPALKQHSKLFCGGVRKARPASAVALLAGALVGCSAYETVSELISRPFLLPCPHYRVVADAAKLVRFHEGPGRDLIDINYEIEIEGVRLGCASDVDKKTRLGIMDVEITVSFKAQRGPANRDRRAPIEYFISVIDGDRKILYREAFKAVIGFPGNKTRVTTAPEPVTLEIPITATHSSRSYNIFTGFKLTPEELRFNRTRLGK